MREHPFAHEERRRLRPMPGSLEGVAEAADGARPAGDEVDPDMGDGLR